MGTIIVSNLGKAYKTYSSPWSKLAHFWLPKSKTSYMERWVIRDINFIVRPGESVGILGANGAGKSTLLKLIAGITTPTIGSVSTNGRVASLLELGIGFDPNFSGRQNLFMAGYLLGLSTNEIIKLMPQIEDFAEIGDYIDQQVRVYSSGMQMRLAFSIATALRPDILIIDEALAVGDSYFQHKSYNRITEFKALGTTLFIVSHDKTAILNICDRAILLNEGNLVMDDKPQVVVDYYNGLQAPLLQQQVRQISKKKGKIQTISGSRKAELIGINLFDNSGREIETLSVGQNVTLKLKIKANSDIDELVIGYLIKDKYGQMIFGTNTYQLKSPIYNVIKGNVINCAFNFEANLGVGNFSVSVALHSGLTHLVANYEWQDLALVFDVLNLYQNSFVGLAWLPPKLELENEL